MLRSTLTDLRGILLFFLIVGGPIMPTVAGIWLIERGGISVAAVPWVWAWIYASLLAPGLVLSVPAMLRTHADRHVLRALRASQRARNAAARAQRAAARAQRA